MKTFAPLMCAAAAAALLAGCAYDEGYGHRGYYSGASYGAGYGYDSYYDNYYGPLYDGYWGGDGAFYYRGAEGRPYQRDTGDHFRRDQHQGYNRVQGQTRGGAPIAAMATTTTETSHVIRLKSPSLNRGLSRDSAGGGHLASGSARLCGPDLAKAKNPGKRP